MAKSRVKESGRDRSCARPPRRTGMGLLQVSLLAGLGAVVFCVVGVLGAGSGKDPALMQTADALGAGMTVALTAAEPDTWHEMHGTISEMRKLLREHFPEVNWGKVTPEAKKGIETRDYQVRDRNKKRLDVLEGAFGNLETGPLRGIMIRSSDVTRMGDFNLGARIDPAQFTTQATIHEDVSVCTLTAAFPAGGSFPARVYHRAYKDRLGAHVGDVYVILARQALASRRGAGIWLALAPLLVALAAGVLVIHAAKAAEGLKGLARDLDQIGRGRLDLRVRVTGGGEVGFLQETADRMAKNLQLIQTTGSGDLDEALEKELDSAGQIHQSLRPADAPHVPGYEIETLSKIGRAIGGDYYDYLELDEHRLALVIADCSESLRGVPAAMVMAMTRAYLKAAVDPDKSPGEWLKTVNRRLARDLKAGMAVTAQIVVLDHSTHQVLAVSAGHRPLILWRGGKTATINPNGIALGLDIGPVFNKTLEEKRFALNRNDRLVLHTDGVISAANAHGEAYGDTRFQEAIRRQGAMNSAAFVNFIGGGVDKFLGTAEQDDDITVCTLKRMK